MLPNGGQVSAICRRHLSVRERRDMPAWTIAKTPVNRNEI
jgi:hypothetical protein